ncbi:hypothetical protein CZ794_08380 [Psychrobacter sp. JB385]|nr:hypothetical protein CZ794_08380 [Psychrobacter sp. JB385]
MQTASIKLYYSSALFSINLTISISYIPKHPCPKKQPMVL